MTDGRSTTLALGVLVMTLVATLAVFPGVAHAEERAGGSVLVGANQTVDGDLRAVGGRVVVRGTVNGDLTVAAGSLVIKGTVTGDVIGAAGIVIVEGSVGGDVRLGAGRVVIAGPIDGNAEIGARNLTFLENGRIGGSLRTDAASIEGLQSDTVGGNVERIDASGDLYPFLTIGPIGEVLYFTAVHLLFGAILLGILPTISDRTVNRIRERPLFVGLVGVAAAIATAISLAVLAVTIVGLPIAILGLVGFLAALWIGGIYASVATGRVLLATVDRDHRWGGLLVGIGAVAILGAIPILGYVLQAGIVLLGFGGLTVVATTAYRR